MKPELEAEMEAEMERKWAGNEEAEIMDRK